jgi:hypothetical protein
MGLVSSIFTLLTVIAVGIGIYMIINWLNSPSAIGEILGENLSCVTAFPHPSGAETSHPKDNVFADMSICYKCPFGHQDRTVLAVTNNSACEGTCAKIRTARIDDGTFTKNSASFDNDFEGYPIIYHDPLASLCYACGKGASRTLNAVTSETACNGPCTPRWGDSWSRVGDLNCYKCTGTGDYPWDIWGGNKNPWGDYGLGTACWSVANRNTYEGKIVGRRTSKALYLESNWSPAEYLGPPVDKS